MDKGKHDGMFVSLECEPAWIYQFSILRVISLHELIRALGFDLSKKEKKNTRVASIENGDITEQNGANV